MADINQIKVGNVYICKVKRLLQHGVIVDIDDTGKEGFIHISELSNRWVNDVKDVVKEGEQIVCKIVEQSPQMIELSAKRVNDNEKKQMLKEWSIEKRLSKLIENTEKNPAELIKSIKEEYGSLYNLYEELTSDNTNALDKFKFGKDSKTAILNFVEKGKKKLTIKTKLTARSYDGDGVEKIKKLFSERLSDPKNYDIKYIKAPDYMLIVSAGAPKKTLAENKKILGELEKKSKEYGVEFSYKEIKK
ncbi:MAG: S1 RNA-binding domain-containing protein [Nanoarchaeota archaeon]|nr:S1 RNA-binding domain-containing protein [Nanoarchaeota archaeon]